MRIIIYSTKSFERRYFIGSNEEKHELCFVLDRLTLKTADKAKDFQGVSCLVSDVIDEQLMKKLAENGVRFITLRSNGYDYVQGEAAKEYNNLLLNHLNLRHNRFLKLQCA